MMSQLLGGDVSVVTSHEHVMSGTRAVALVVLGERLERATALRFAPELDLEDVVAASEGRQVAVLRLVLGRLDHDLRVATA